MRFRIDVFVVCVGALSVGVFALIIMGVNIDPPKPRTTMTWDGGPDPYGFTSLEHRIHQSDVVAHVRLRSIVPDGTNQCYDDGEWIPVVPIRI